MKKDNRYDHCCYCCEYASELIGGDSYICKKKGVVSPEFACSSFIFDPLKKEVSVRFIPDNIDSNDFKI